MSIRIAVDIGGTFTDLEIADSRTGAVHEMKTPSTPHDPSIGLLNGIRAAMTQHGFATGDITHLLHGTTIATNAVLERKLPLGAVVTTAGFEDVLTIGRHGRREIYAITADPVRPLVQRRHCLGVVERTRADGSIERALDEDSVRAVAEKLRAADIRAVAVCLLHSYADPAHEQRVAALLAEMLPGVAVGLSSDISPEIREYERLSTTVLNALLRPIVDGYMAQLSRRLAEAGIGGSVYLVQSNGGVSGIAKAGREPARLLLSGPSGGAAAAQRLAERLGRPNLVAIDMGGTSFDVSVVHQGAVATVNEGEVDGWPVRLPMVEMRTIGAGGGSIVWVDEGGRLRIGPHSAGAAPGPACYGRGGTELTVTDANLLLGRLDAARFLGGAMPLDVEAAQMAAALVAQQLGSSVAECVAGVIAVTNSSLATAIRLSLFEKGLDPEDFALLSFGGAGGVHACEVADELGIATVVFPPHASTLSAWGILFSDIVHDLTATMIGALAERGPALAAQAARLRGQADALLDDDSVPEAARAYRWTIDCRYAGQAFELPLVLDDADFSAAGLGRAATAFHALHQQRFSYQEPKALIEIMALRLAATGRLATPATPPASARDHASTPQHRDVLENGILVSAIVCGRDHAILGRGLPGPVIVEEAYTSTYIPLGWHVVAEPTGALIATRGDGA